MEANSEDERLRSRWRLDPNVVFLNHGSFGACPRAVLNEQARLRDELEKEPVLFLTRAWEQLWEHARQRLSEFVGCQSQDMVLVPNATHGVNSVLRSLDFHPGDQILITNHTYNACANAARFVADRHGAELVVAEIPIPVSSDGQVVEAVLDAVTPQTRLAVLDHVTSPTSLVLPIADLVAQLSQLGVETLIDGAHAPGMVPVDIVALNPTYYAANCHKWVCAPKGSGFLYVHRSKQEEIRPLAISHGANSPRVDRSRYHLEFDWTGTHDPTSYLCIPHALDYLGGLFPNGWTELRQRNHAAAVHARKEICQRLSVAPLCPDAMMGAMFTLELPSSETARAASQDLADALHDRLFDEHSIELPVISFGDKLFFRVSYMLYNSQEDISALIAAIDSING